jgi:hypothetical protein
MLPNHRLSSFVLLALTGDYAYATGYLTATGTFLNGAGVGVYVGVVCQP